MVKEIKIITWVATRDEECAGVFLDRKDAVKWIKELLKQTLKDLGKQDKTDEFTYPIQVPKYEIKSVENRKPYLGL